MGCFTKSFLFLLNFIVFALGVALISLAAVVVSGGQYFDVLLADGVFTIPIVLLIIGIIVTLLGFFGCCGAAKESSCLLNTYAVVVSVLLIAQIAVVIYAGVQRHNFEKLVADGMTKTMDKYGGSDDSLTKSIDTAQYEAHCCGVHNYTDWYSGELKPENMTGDVPSGCCKEGIPNCNTNIRNLTPEEAAERIFTTGCFTLLSATVESNALWLIIGVVVLALVEIACISIACGIARRAGRAEVY